MKLNISRGTYFLETSLIFRWLDIITNAFAFLAGWLFLSSDINLGPGTKFMVMILIIAIVMGLFLLITELISYFFCDKVEIASFKDDKLSLSLDFYEEFDTKKINSIKYYGPPSWVALFWPYIKYTIRIDYNGQVKEIKTCFRLKSLENFFNEVNKEITNSTQ
ncbi:hypothetical protein [Nitrincola lacisaponensis]|uniref:hypothetical protein n=1 Tax=Nitrincola lacisaponensis TaxID=267850 RepID=UPI00055D8755|nr:hypothetical protein [Nitrincola lacisaponensis]